MGWSLSGLEGGYDLIVVEKDRTLSTMAAKLIECQPEQVELVVTGTIASTLVVQ